MRGPVIRRIIVFKPGPIGDFLHSLPAVEALRNAFPDARITVVTARELADLVEAHPAVDERIYVPWDLFRGDVRGLLRFIGELRARRPDLFVDMKSNVKSFLMRRLSGAGKVLRYRKQKRVRPGERRLHAVENLLETVEPATGKVPGSPFRVYLRREDEEATDAFLRDTLPAESPVGRKVALNPTVGWAIPSRLWPPESFGRLGDRIARELGAGVFFTGGPSDREYLDKIAAGMTERPVIAAGRLTLGETAALIKRCDLLVSGDTGPLHIAAGVGTKVIGLYGSVSTDRSQPWGEGHVVIKKDLWCLPCEEKVCPLATMQCMKDITVDEVFEEVRKVLGKLARISESPTRGPSGGRRDPRRTAEGRQGVPDD